MPFIYITGVEGSGKTTICKALSAKGYTAIDIDEEGLSSRYDKDTWNRASALPPANQSSSTWYLEREWKIKPGELLKIKQPAQSEIVFVCGITDNFNEIKDIFDKIICLTLDEAAIRKRLATRTTNNFGKNAAELEYIFSKHEAYEEDNKDFGSIMVDASRSLAEVIDAILS